MSVGHYENFPVASLLLPAPLREPVEVIYRFARSADDIADEGDDPPDVRLRKLSVYRSQLAAPVDPLFHDVAKLIAQQGLPPQLFADLLDAFSQDVTKKSYENFSTVLDYCRRSANPVGRLLLHLFKRTTDSDLQRDEMARFGVDERHLRDKICDEAWQALLSFQTKRARELMLQGAPLGRSLPGRVGLEIRATVQGGLKILDKIEQAGYDVFRRRPTLKSFDWPLLLLKAV